VDEISNSGGLNKECGWCICFDSKLVQVSKGDVLTISYLPYPLF
jgi:hypothetical protein